MRKQNTLIVICFVLAVSSIAQGSAMGREEHFSRLVLALCNGAIIDTLRVEDAGSMASGQLSAQGVKCEFSLRLVTQPEDTSFDVYHLTVSEPDIETYLAQRFLRNVAVTPIPYHDAIAVTQRGSSELLHRHIPDSRAQITEIESVLTGPLVGDGSSQVRFHTVAAFLVNSPTEVVATGIDRILRIPELTEVFSGMTFKTVYSSTQVKDVEIEPQYYRLEPSSEGNIKSIVLTTKHEPRAAVYTYDGTKYNQIADSPDHRSLDGIRQRVRRMSEISAQKYVLSLRVVDENGLPISGAYVGGVWSVGDSWLDPEGVKVGSFSGRTDADGRISLGTPGQISLKIEAAGYRDVNRTWIPGEVPKDLVTVELQKAPKAVPMFKIVQGTLLEKSPSNTYAFGFIVSEDPGADPIVEDREKADIWVEVTETDTNNEPGAEASATSVRVRSWSLTINGLNGWTIAPGPPRDAKTKPVMAVAPESGYLEKLTLVDFESATFYIHHAESGKYGKIDDLNFSERPNHYKAAVEALVQEVNFDTRSLYPMSGMELHEYKLNAANLATEKRKTSRTQTASRTTKPEENHQSPHPSMAKDELHKPTPTEFESKIGLSPQSQVENEQGKSLPDVVFLIVPVVVLTSAAGTVAAIRIKANRRRHVG